MYRKGGDFSIYYVPRVFVPTFWVGGGGGGGAPCQGHRDLASHIVYHYEEVTTFPVAIHSNVLHPLQQSSSGVTRIDQKI